MEIAHRNQEPDHRPGVGQPDQCTGCCGTQVGKEVHQHSPGKGDPGTVEEHIARVQFLNSFDGFDQCRLATLGAQIIDEQISRIARL